MVVEDCISVLGRGWVVIVDGEEFDRQAIHCGDKILCNGKEFTIFGIERLRFLRHCGLVLGSAPDVPECFKVGQEVEIKKKNYGDSKVFI